MAFSKSKSISFKAFWILTEILAVFALVFPEFLTEIFFTYFSITRKCLIGSSTSFTRHTVRPVKPGRDSLFGCGLQRRRFRVMIFHLEFGDFHVIKQVSQAIFRRIS